LRQDGGGGLETGLGPGSDADQILTAWARVPADVEANPGKYYSRVEYDNWGHYASFYGTASFSVWSAVCPPLAFLPGMKTEAGGAFWSGLFRTSDDVSSEFYAVSNGITRVSGAALMVLACPASASTIYRLGLSFWASDQTLTGIDSMATGQDRQTLGGRALSPVLGQWFGNFVYDLGPPGPSAVNGLRNVAGWVKNLLRNPSKAADDVIDLADELAAPSRAFSAADTARFSEIRSTIRGIGNKRNVAFAEGHVGGKSIGEIVGVSGKNTPGAIMPSDRIFKTGIDEFDRAFDAEVFVLENLARKLKPGDSGTIKLVSELPFCDSCSDVIRQFREMFPNIRLILIDGT
ncbi:MAG: deaminase domain-containing protein, partial [Planctomycetota bacterium]